MNLNSLRDLDPRFIKGILVIIYCILFVLTLIVVDGSLADNLKELLLQVGEVINDQSPKKVKP